MAQSTEFGVGEVARTAARLLRRKAGAFTALSLAGFAPVLVAIVLVVTVLIMAPEDSASATAAAVILYCIVTLAGFAWSQAAIIYCAVRTLRAEPPTIGQAARRALPKIAPVAAVILLGGLAAAAGTLLLVVPGIVLWLMFWVAVPAAVVEGGVVSALRRSHELTRGHKWTILGLAIVLMLAMWLGALVVMAGPMIASVAAAGLVWEFIAMFAQLGAALLVQVLAWAVWGVVVAASYYHLRLAAEGGSGRDIVDVFD